MICAGDANGRLHSLRAQVVLSDPTAEAKGLLRHWIPRKLVTSTLLSSASMYESNFGTLEPP